MIVIFFMLILPKNGSLQLNWWGNTVVSTTYDYWGYALKKAPTEGFGSFPKY
ncbi:hypothetical protein [Sporisorium scitamineum]|uniref:Uncharacterized protein n=1 Tax=Sporisorium scitamineum TaxID=49012 RepID=A0A0F7S5G4_9BASI|nr:hypothetical protein [Sporisorium scitamineum]